MSGHDSQDAPDHWSREDLFEHDPVALAICEAVERVAGALPGVTVRVGKSQVGFRRRRGFAYLWRPGRYVASSVPVVLSLALPDRLASARFKEVVNPSPGVWMHHLELNALLDVDDEVGAWIRDAYDAAS